MIIPQQPVRLIQPVLPQQRRALVEGGQALVLHNRKIGRIKHTLERIFFVKPLGQVQNMVVCLRRGADDHLGTLPRRCKGLRLFVAYHLALALGAACRDLPHGTQNGGALFVRGQPGETCLAGQLDIDGQPVRQQAQPLHQLRVCARNGLGMDVPVETVFLPQQAQCLNHALHGGVRAAHHRAGQKQPLDVVAAVKANGQFGQFTGREGGAGTVIAAAVDAVAAIVDADVGIQHF